MDTSKFRCNGGYSGEYYWMHVATSERSSDLMEVSFNAEINKEFLTRERRQDLRRKMLDTLDSAIKHHFYE